MFPEVEVFRVHSSEDPGNVDIKNGRGREQGVEATHGVKVDLDASNVRSSDRDHAKEPVFPPPQEGNSFVQNEKVM